MTHTLWSRVCPIIFSAGGARNVVIAGLCLCSQLVPGCAQSAHQSGRDMLDRLLPDHVQQQVDQSVAFVDLKANPAAYYGKTVMVGGIVLKSKRVKDRTEIEVLQIPAGSGAAPTRDRARSQGRFLAVKSGEFLDPALFDAGTPVTVVGEVGSPVTRGMDEGEYTYPVLEIKHVVDWDEVNPKAGSAAYAYPYAGSMYAYPYSYGGPFGGWGGWYGGYPGYGYGYPYYGPFFGSGGGSSHPGGPPPASAPPQFKK